MPQPGHELDLESCTALCQAEADKSQALLPSRTLALHDKVAAVPLTGYWLQVLTPNWLHLVANKYEIMQKQFGLNDHAQNVQVLAHLTQIYPIRIHNLTYKFLCQFSFLQAGAVCNSS